MATNKWETFGKDAMDASDLLALAITRLQELQSVAAGEIAKYLRQGRGIELDPEAIAATIARPYTLIPVNENEATLIHWRGVKMPLFGWVVKQEPAFTISKVTRGMGLLTPYPQWMKDELGWRPPEHAAQVFEAGTKVRLTDGSADSFKRRYGKFLKGKDAEGNYTIKGGDAWIRLIAELIKDGILPYTPQPVSDKDWKSRAISPIDLRDYQDPFVKEFRQKGAVFFNLPPGAGKTMICLNIMAHIIGPVVILAPSVILCEQWRERVKQFAPQADVTILTYASGRKALKREWTLVVFDEVQTLPADTFSKLAFLKTKYRIGLSASPWREDGRQYMITALSGYPCAIRWADLIRAGVLKRPRVVIATVQDEAAKTAFTKQLIDRRKGGRALIFCDYLEAGQSLADALDVPFVSGSTSRKLEKVTEAEVCVVSRIADRGLDFTDLTLIVEWAFLGKSREQEAQRLGRLLHSQSHGEHYLLFTASEADKFRSRIFGIESELAGEIDLEFLTVGKITAQRERSVAIHAGPSRRRGPSAPAVSPGPETEPKDEAGRALALRPIAVKIDQAERSVGASTRPYIRRVFRYCFYAPLSPKEIADGLGIVGSVARSRIRSSCNALAKAGLMDTVGERFKTSDGEIKRAQALGSLIK